MSDWPSPANPRERREVRQTCHLCRRNLDSDNFHSDRSRFNGLASQCRDCTRFRKLAENRGRSWAEVRADCAAHRHEPPGEDWQLGAIFPELRVKLRDQL